MYNGNDYNYPNKFLPQDRSNLDYYDVKFFLPSNNMKKSTEITATYSSNLPKLYSFGNEGNPNIDNVNYTNRMKNERKGQLL